MCPGATMDYLASALLPALSFNNPTNLSSHQLITWHFFGASAFQSDFLFIDLGFEKGTLSGCEFQASGRFLRSFSDCVDWDWKWPLLCFGGWKLKCRVAVLEASWAFFPPEGRETLHVRVGSVRLALLREKKKLFEWVCPYALFHITEETNRSIVLAKRPPPQKAVVLITVQ